MITCSGSTFTTTNGTPAGRETAAITFTGCSFKYNNATKGVVTATAKSMVELSERIVIFPDKKSYDTVGGAFAAFGTGTYPTAGSVPDIDYACVLDNRIWAVKGDDIFCTALGDFDDWTTFSSPSEATDAWQVDTGTNGSFTGIASYKGTNLAFKLDRVWKRFGDIPENFQFVEISKLGCVSHKSICEVNNILFWLSPLGVVMYTGGVPEVISDNLNDSYVSAVSGGDGRRYYISLYNGSTYALYVYDTWTGLFMQEDTLQVKDFSYLDGYLYALASDNKIWKFNSGSEVVSSSLETKDYTLEIFNKKALKSICFRITLATGSTATFYTSKDGAAYVSVKTLSTVGLNSYTIPMKLQMANRIKIKLSVSGEFTLHQTTFEYAISEN
jgi:hypothetical protein